MIRSSNPALRSSAFVGARVIGDANAMTVDGVITKTGMLLLCVILTAGWTWMRFYQAAGNPEAITGWMMFGALAGFALAMVTVFKQAWAPVTAPLYALAEGFFIGGISSLMELKFPGIVIQASLLTFGTLVAMLAAYRAGWVRATEGFKLGLMAATGGIALVYFITLVLSFFHVQVPFIYGSGMAGIAFSLFVVVIAALNFVIDFDVIEKGAEYGAPKYMEWYGGFALMVTLIWLYVEFLRLLSKVRESR